MKFYVKRTTALICVLLFFGMIASAQKGKSTQKKVHVTPTNDLVKNGIILKSNGFMVAEAYLVFDDESLVPEGNKVELHQNVNMLLIIDSGWTEVGGRVYPGSKQVLKLSDGALILDSEELFAAFDETGVSPEDARYITLNTVVTDIKDKRKHVVVNFRLWDKKGNAEITGSYKLFIK